MATTNWFGGFKGVFSKRRGVSKSAALAQAKPRAVKFFTSDDWVKEKEGQLSAPAVITRHFINPSRPSRLIGRLDDGIKETQGGILRYGPEPELDCTSSTNHSLPPKKIKLSQEKKLPGIINR